MEAKLLTEQYKFAGGKVNREGGFIDDVLICGTSSANNRDYPTAVFRRDFAKYEGRPVNADHGREATVSRRLGWFSNVKVGEDGKPRGRLNLLKSHDLYESVMEAAERNPALYGMSHVAMCKTRRDISTGREVVESIEEVESIDLVADPATTPGFFESRRKGKAVKISLKTFVERFGAKWGPKRWADATKLVEELGDMGDAPVMDEPPADGGDEGDLKSGLMAALQPFLEEAFESGNSDKACSALRDFVKMHAKHTGNSADSGDKADEPDGDEPTPESKQPNPWDVLRECTEAGYTPSPTELETLSLQPDPAKRKAFLTEQKAKQANAKAEKPQSAPRKPGADQGGKKVEEQTIPTDAKKFAASIRG